MPGRAALADLGSYRADLAAVLAGRAASPRWPQVFEPLAQAIRRTPCRRNVAARPAGRLRAGRRQQRYADRAELLDYCRRSANPVGRLLLHLYGVDERSLRHSDAICTALQLINFWRDLSVDTVRGRSTSPSPTVRVTA